MRFHKVIAVISICLATSCLPFLVHAQQTVPAPATTPPPPLVVPPPPVVPAPPVVPTTPVPSAPAVTAPTAPIDTAPESAPAEASADDMSIGDIPIVKTEELTAEMARKALDAYVLVQSKYQDSPLESYEDLQGFVDADIRGKEFETDIKAFNFPTVDAWNLTITTLSFAYTNVLDDQTADIKQQIEELKVDTEMAQDIKDRMISSLNAMIPSANNTKIVNDLIADTTYAEKIKLLETTEE